MDVIQETYQKNIYIYLGTTMIFYLLTYNKFELYDLNNFHFFLFENLLLLTPINLPETLHTHHVYHIKNMSCK